jgi:hypothetical protein
MRFYPRVFRCVGPEAVHVADGRYGMSVATVCFAWHPAGRFTQSVPVGSLNPKDAGLTYCCAYVPSLEVITALRSTGTLQPIRVPCVAHSVLAWLGLDGVGAYAVLGGRLGFTEGARIPL